MLSPNRTRMVMLGVVMSVGGAATVGGEHWPGFRGKQAGGVGEGKLTATTWDVKSSRNIQWKTPIPGLGHSSPVVWGNRVFVTTAISGRKNPELVVGLYGNIAPVNDTTSHTWWVYCVAADSGRILWRKKSHEGVPAIKRHTKATHANSTPVTDGEHVVAFFGSEGLYCYDMAGKLLWKQDLGRLDAGYYMVPQAQWEFGSSPIIYKKLVIVQCDVQENSFLAAFNIDTGEEVWRVSRQDVPTWSTPTIVEAQGRTQLVVNGYQHIGGYNPDDGSELWMLSGGGDIPVPTPIFAHDLIFITSAHGGLAPMYAIRPTAKGDITLKGDETSNKYVVWSHPRRGNYMQTPLVYGEYLYSCRDNGVLTCFEARTGRVVYRERIGDGSTGFTASAVASHGKLYYTSEEGDVFVVKAGATFEVLAKNALGEVCMSSPAIAGGVIFFHTRDHLVAVSESFGGVGGAPRTKKKN